MDNLDPTLLAHIIANPSLFPPPPTESPKDVQQVGAGFETAISRLVIQIAHYEDKVDVTTHVIKSFDGAEITIYDCKPKNRAEPTEPERAILYYHGGGNVSCSLESVTKYCMYSLAIEHDVRVFGVEFRLAPEYPYPTPVEDCYAAVKWVQENEGKLNVDPKRLGLIGESGGGNLVAGVALLARDRELSPPIAKAMMICPMLDDRSERHANPETSSRDKGLVGFSKSIDICWDAYLSNKRGQPGISPYAAPSRAETLRGFPSAYIDIGTLDAFVQETLEFGSRLVKEDVEVEMHMYKGMPHGFDFAAPGVPAVLDTKANRKRAIWGI